MSIKDFLAKIKSLKEHFSMTEDLFVVALICIVGLGSFGLGKLSTYEKKKPEIQIRQSATVLEGTKAQTVQTTETRNGVVFASKSGTRYYYPHCKSSVLEQNKVWYGTIAEAEAKGLSLASGCKPI